MLEVTDIVYQGGGMVIAFNDNSTVVAVPKVVNGQLTLEGLTDEQETALELFNDAANVDRLVADPRTNLIFGDDFQFVEDETESSISGTAGFQTKIELTTPILTGIYLLMWHCQGKVEGPDDGRIEMKCRNLTDGVDLGVQQALNITPFPGGGLRHILDGHKIISFVAESKTFCIVWRTSDNDNTAYVRRARLTFWRIR